MTASRSPGEIHAASEMLIKLLKRKIKEYEGWLTPTKVHFDSDSWRAILMMNKDYNIGQDVYVFDGALCWMGLQVNVVTRVTKQIKPVLPQIMTIECIDSRTQRIVYVNHPDNPPEYL